MKKIMADWKYRDCKIQGHVGTLRVPRHIVRIDIDDGGAGTHGWQVRFRKPSRFFSDSYLDSRGRRRLGSPKASLARATEYLRTIYRPKPRKPRPEHRDKAHPTGMAGVRVAWNRRPGRKFAECIVRADRVDGKPLATFYVGTENTVTKYRLAQAIKNARARRMLYLLEVR